ncbi:hypothetical protein IJT17_08790 [bacterium]|nr:hypothetical protein [bacterium]
MKFRNYLCISAAVIIIAAAGTLVFAAMDKKTSSPAPSAEPRFLTKLEYSYDQYSDSFSSIIIKRDRRQGPVSMAVYLRDGSTKDFTTGSEVFDSVMSVMERYKLSTWHDGSREMECIDGTDEAVYFKWSDGQYCHESAQEYPEGCEGFFTEVKRVLVQEYRRLEKAPQAK